MHIQPLRRHIFKILFYVIFILFLFIAVGAGFYQYASFKKQYILSMQGQVNIAKSLIVSQLLKDDQRFTKIAAHASNEQSPARMLEYLSRTLLSFDPFDIFYILDSSGKIVRISISYKEAYLNLNFAHMNHVKNKKKISSVYQSIFSKQTVVALTYTLGFGYCLIIERDLKNIIPSLSHLEKGFLLPRQIIFLLDDQGKTMYYPDSDLVRTRHNILFDFKNYTKRGAGELSSYEYNGESFLAYTESLDIPERWQLFIQAPLSGMRNKIFKTMIWQFLLLSTIFIVVMVALQSVLNHFFSKPVHNIAMALASYKSDKRQGAVIPEERAGKIKEFHQIIEAVNHMAADLIHSNRVIKERERTLQESEAKYRGLVESSSDWIWEVDAQGVYTYVSPQVEAMLGYKPEEVLGKTPFDFMMPEDAVRIDKKFKAMAKAGKPIPVMENINVHKDGSRVILETSGIPVFDAQGKLVSYRGIDRDITRRKKMEALMVQNEKMLSVGGLAAGMAHEINNPLAGMMQTASVMENRLTKIDIPANLSAAKEVGITMGAVKAFMEKRDILRMVKAINTSGQRMVSIVENMLSFARKSDTLISTHNPAELMDKILELAATDYDLKKQYDFKTIKIIKEYEDNLPLIPCEGAKIQQVFLNILRNGSQAMQETKTASPCFVLRLLCDPKAGMLQIEIEDNGPGMDEAVRKRIFEPFFTTKPVGMGTGLGLSVSYFIITENHGGTLNVISEPGVGARFIIRLPLERKNA